MSAVIQCKRGQTSAQQVRAMGLQVGDTIEGREEYRGAWNEARLTLLWIGETVAVWREQSRCSALPQWRDEGESSDWTLDCRPWHKISSAAPTSSLLSTSGENT